MEELLAQQKVTAHAIDRALDNFKKIGKVNLTLGIVRHRLQKLKEDYAKYELQHAKILAAATHEFSTTHKYFTEDKFSACEAAYLTASDVMAEWLSKLEPQPAFSPESSPVSRHLHQSFATRSTFQLPRITLPKFSGEFCEWEVFRDQFKALIINNGDLLNVNRLQYLYSCLKGDAFNVICKLAVTDANFNVAWDLLTARYDNQRRLVHEHIHTLHTLPHVNAESAVALSALRDKANIAIQALKNLGRAVDTWDDILVYLIAQKLDKATRKAWELLLGDTVEYPSYEQLEQFLASRIRAFENILPPTPPIKGKSNASSVQTHIASANSVKCPLCQKTHFLSSCIDFRGKAVEERRELAQKFRCCFNCLSTKHNRNACPSKYTCRQCQQKHHTLLHHDSNNKSTESRPSSNAAPVEETAIINTHLLSETSFSKSKILLATAWIVVSGSNGRKDVVRALLDQGSVTTLITERLAQRLRLKRTRVSVHITGIGDAASNAKYAAQLNVSGRDVSFPALSVHALVLKSLTNYVPPRVENLTKFDHLCSLNLADRDPTSPDPVEVIIGADLYGSSLLPGIRSRSPHEPVAQNSIFGWIISGPMPTRSSADSLALSMHHCTVHENLDAQLKKFWEIEELPQQTHLTPEEIRCENHFMSTHFRTPGGRYVVRLPFKTDPPLNLGESRLSALAMYTRTESRLRAQPNKADEYNDFLHEYERLGHMANVHPPDKSANQIVYIPHHAVIREHSATTHLRVVFNASSPTSNGLSLNDHLMIGPKLQTDLPSIITRWRQWRYVYTADIAKMYRQILIDARDVDYQRILWRPDTQSPVGEYQLLTVTYGMASAPYLALRVLQQVAMDDGEDYPLAVPIIRQHMFVDDCVFGTDDVPLAHQTRDHLISLLSRAGFQLRKWASNHPALLTGIDPHNHGLEQSKLLQIDETVKVLGIKWDPSTDTFQFEVTPLQSIPETKRSILSAIAKLFDPLGWITPVVIKAKILMQKLWLLRCDWDQAIPEDLLTTWRTFYLQLSILSEISISRWSGQGSDTVAAEIHGFADASTSAYGAVLYLKLTQMDGSVQITLLTAKSKVAPLKPISIPRLELCATVLLAKTIAFARPLLNLSRLAVHCWTDSAVVLAWLSQSPSRWKVFVANRVHEVQSLIPDANWHYVASQQNPADLASRGVNPSTIVHHLSWWQGPEWLKLSSDQWPRSALLPASEPLQEERTKASVHLAQAPPEWDLSTRFSSWTKLVHVTAYVMRFTGHLRQRSKQRSTINNSEIAKEFQSTNLLPEEVKNAQTFWLISVQRRLFSREYALLQNACRVHKNSKLSALNPYLDESGLIRVGGRLRHSNLEEKTKHPIVLAAHPLVSLLIQSTHLRALHAGPQLMLSLIREEFWLLRARQTIRAVLYRCVKCARESAVTATELMGDLPLCRVRPSGRAFLHCGIDYAGPIQIRSTPGRGHKSRKAYIAVFVCMTVKAVHLELVSECSTQAFLAAFDRFCARRGVPSNVYSDNATNFQGAQRELNAIWRAAASDPNVLNKLAEQGINWNFIPPSSPHFGGLWEACVRSVKHHMKRVIGAHTLTAEEMSTLLCKIEACLNSRPIAQMSDNYDDYNALTPSHFLIGSMLMSIPEPSLLEEKESRLTRWQLISHMRDSFWKAWSHDYLQTLQQRPKWREIQNKARVGRLVLLRNALVAPSNWELGRIEECHPGDDGLTRVVTVRTARSRYKRALTKLCFLPVDLNTDAEPPSSV